MNKEQLIDAIVADILATAQICYEFNYTLYADELAEKYSVSEADIEAYADVICEKVGAHKSVAAVEFGTDDKGFYTTFNMAYCPLSQEDEDEQI